MSKSDGRTSQPFRRIRRRILAESDICWLCGKPGADTVDHILPLSMYPELANDAANLRPAHRSCNSRRGQGIRPNQQQPRVQSRQW